MSWRESVRQLLMMLQMLAVGTSKGMLEVYSCMSEGLKVIAKVLAHPPRKGPQDKRFGQLTKQ